AGGGAGLEEVPGGGGLGGGRDDRRRRAAVPGDVGQQLGVDLRAVEVGHHDAGGQLGDLPRHPDEHRPPHAGAGGVAEGDAREVPDLDDRNGRDVGPGAQRIGLGPAPGGQHDAVVALGGGHVDLLDHRRPVGGGGEGLHDPGGAEDGDP